MLREAGSKPCVAVCVAFDELLHAEIWFEPKQALADQPCLFDLSGSRQARRQKSQIGSINRVFGVGSPSPGDCLLVIALSISGEPERAMRNKDVGLKRRESKRALGATARLGRL